MKVAVDGQQVEWIEDTLNGIEQWWKSSTSRIYQDRRLIHFVEVNGKAIYEAYELYIVQNIQEVREVNIHTLSATESIQDTEQALDEYLERFVPGALDIADQLYGGLTIDNQPLFGQLLEGFHWIVKSMQFDNELYVLAEYHASPDYLTSALSTLERVLQEIMQAVENNDFTGVSDLLQYEVVPALQQFQNRNKMSGLS
ncbi:hypothetical protein [Paenibacillus timonensis]|uniref:hypothetical protein n=1 Tax=Paenibacillus timonensis TaxID=225915 RepID=UPI0022E5EEEF|nr:hypothetical protein [Paenibacillus timonensis]